MKALLSGQAGVAVVLGDEPQFRPIEGEAYTGTQADIAMTFAGFPDVETVEVDSIGVLDRQLGRSFAADRAKFLLFMLLDGEQDEGDRRDIADEIERLVSHYRVKGEVTSQLAKISPEEGSLEKAQLLAAEFLGIAPLLAALYPGVESAKDRVLVLFDDVAGRGERLAELKSVTHTGRIAGSGYDKMFTKGLKLGRIAVPATASYPEQFRKLLNQIVDQARASLVSGRAKPRRSHLTRLSYVDARELDKVVDRAQRKIAAQIKEAGLDIAPPPRAELKVMIRTSRHPVRVGKVTARKFGRKVSHAS